MEGEERVRTAFERNAQALRLRSSLGRGTAVTRVRLREGLTCEIEEGRWKFVADMGPKSGGSDEGPNPGVLARAALGSCLAMGYMMWATRLGIPLSSLEVEVHADYDSRGYHGVNDVKPGYSQIRYVVSIESDATEERIMNLLDEADAHSDFLNVFAEAQDVRREVRIAVPGS